MKCYSFVILSFLCLFNSEGYSQSTYPKRVVLNGDSLVLFTPAQTSYTYSLFEENEFLKTQISLLLSSQDTVIVTSRDKLVRIQSAFTGLNKQLEKKDSLLRSTVEKVNTIPTLQRDLEGTKKESDRRKKSVIFWKVISVLSLCGLVINRV